MDQGEHFFQRGQLVFLSLEIEIGNCGKTILFPSPHSCLSPPYTILSLLEILQRKILPFSPPFGLSSWRKLVEWLTPLGTRGEESLHVLPLGSFFSSCTCVSGVCRPSGCLTCSLFHTTSSPGQACSWDGRDEVAWSCAWNRVSSTRGDVVENFFLAPSPCHVLQSSFTMVID